jgi:predicted regulator of Ras-like GTPase activity (Roadblock/LC7/MglB family)
LIGAIDPTLSLDAVVLFKDTGAQLAIWTRDPTSPEVVTVMASTLLGSAETLLESLGDVRPTSFMLETDRRRVLLQRTDAGMALALVASKIVSEATLHAEAYRLASVVRSVRLKETSPRGDRVSLPAGTR